MKTIKPEDDYSAYAATGHNRPNDLAQITILAETQLKAENKVFRLEKELETAKKELAEIAEKLLPEEMDNLGLSTFTTTSGIAIEIKENIRASLTVENRPKGHQWLEEKGYEGLIKTTVVSAFSKGEIQKAKKLAEELQQKGFITKLERSVHHSTLTAFVKEQLTQGKDIPLEVFGVFRQRVAEIDTQKTPRG